jgi:hypothetical protein
MPALRVGMREFRADMAEYIDSDTTVAITRHGQTVGYFIPAQVKTEENLAALRQASKAMSELLETHGIDEEEIVSEFKALRKKTGRNRMDSKNIGLRNAIRLSDLNRRC